MPQASLTAYILKAVPFLQLPIMASVLCVLVQFVGSWYAWFSILFFVMASMCPLLELQLASGPHRDRLGLAGTGRDWRGREGTGLD